MENGLCLFALAKVFLSLAQAPQATARQEAAVAAVAAAAAALASNWSLFLKIDLNFCVQLTPNLLVG